MKDLFLISICFLSTFVCFSQTRDDLIEASAVLEIVADTFLFSEGPASDPHGNLYFTDIQASRIYRLSVDGRLGIVKDPSGRANGLRFDSKGNLLACEGASRSVTSTSPLGKTTILADRYLGKKLNSPNDLWIDAEGGIYFTDPRYDAGWIYVEKDISPAEFSDSLFGEEQDAHALYFIPPDGQPLRRVAEGFANPNGVVGTTDGKTLYVSDTVKKEIYRFDILPDGSLTNRVVFVSEYSDGLTLDEMHNLYITNGGIQIYNPSGERITTIELPLQSSNVCFGGEDRKTLFVTARQALYGIRMKVTGQ